MRRGTGIPRIGAINRSHPQANGLVSCWRAMPDMERGTKWRDLAGKNDGTLTSGPTWRSDSLGFDGVDDCVVVSAASSLDVSTAFTLSVRFRSGGTAQTFRYLLSKVNGAGSDNAYSLLYEYTNDQVEFYSGLYTGSDPRTGSSISIVDTNWHLITYCYDGATWAGYLDGTQVFSTARTFALSSSTGDLAIGAFKPGSNHVEGLFSDVRIYNRALSATEVGSLYRDPLGMFSRVRVPVGRSQSVLPLFRHHYVSQGIA